MNNLGDRGEMRSYLFFIVILIVLIGLSACRTNKSADIWEETYVSIPAPVKIDQKAVDIDTCVALMEDGSLWSWNRYANNTEACENRYVPVIIMNDVIAVSADYNHIMAITFDGILWGYGDNRNGQLGDGTTISCDSPVKIMNDIIAVSTNSTHTAAIESDGTLWAWGNQGGRGLGDGKTEISYDPVKIMGNAAVVSVGANYTMAIDNCSVLWGWGNNGSGELGDGTTTHRSTPVRIMDNAIAVSAGVGHTMAITSDGTLWAWGSNNSSPVNTGRLGAGDTNSSRKPVKIMEGVVSISAGALHTVAITSDDVLWAWGDNRSYQLGDGTLETRHSPVKIMNQVISAFACGGFTMVILSDGSVWGWGGNGSGELGIGSRRGEYEKPPRYDGSVSSAWSSPVQVFEVEGTFQ